MFRSRILVAAAVLVVWPVAATAAPRKVTLADVRAALTGAPERIAARQRAVAAEAEAAAAAGWPATSLTVQTAMHSARLVSIASLPLPILGVEQAARRSARARAAIARAEEGAAAAELRLRATTAWLALYRAGQLAAIAAATAERMASLERVASARRDAGDSSQADVVVASTQAARARVDAEDAARAQAAAAAELAAAIGWDPDAELVAAGPLPAGTAGAAASLDQHPELRAQRRRVDAAVAAVTEARAAARPGLRLEVEVDALDPGRAPTDVLVGLTVDLPLLGRRGAAVDAARVQVAAEEAQAAAVRARLAGGLVAAERRWAAASQRAASFRAELVPAQERSTELVRAAYQGGQSDLAAVIQAERDLLAVRGDAVEAELAAAQAWAEREHASGGRP